MAFPVPNSIIKASKRLCVSVLSECGGPAAIANSVGCDRQYVAQWKKAGYVPLVQVYDVTKVLDVSPWLISYHKLMEVFGEDSPSFESIVKDAPLLLAEKKKILELYNAKQT